MSGHENILHEFNIILFCWEREELKIFVGTKLVDET